MLFSVKVFTMPAAQSVDYRDEGYLEISVEPIDEPDSVYFTRHRPEFDLVFRNRTDMEIRTRQDDEWTGIRWILELEPGGDEILATGNVDLSVAPGGEERKRIEPGLLAYEANAVLGVAGGAIRGEVGRGDEHIEVETIQSVDDISHILYTFTIWDESHYEAVHEQPKRLQKKVVTLARLTAFLAFLQLTAIVAIRTGVI